jgi:hypothetical protein
MVWNLIGRLNVIPILIITILIVLAINLGSYLILYYVHGLNIFSGTEYADFNKKFVKQFDRATFPHPYLGLISFSDEVYRSELSNEPLFSRVYKSSAPNEVRVLLLGGSVAAGLSDLLVMKMNAHFNTDRFSLYSAAQPGYKQPQQYLKLVYLDLLGFRPDIVINYDGFNEIAIPVSENRSLHDPAIFPRSNSRHLVSLLNRSCVALNNRLLNWHSRIPVVALVTLIFAQRCDYEVNTAGPAPAVWPSKYDWPWWTYMFDTAADDDDYAIRSAAIWRESSNGIYQFTKMHSVDYIEVIQPDQHFPNSKIWSQEEQRVNDLPVNPYADAIRKYYKLLSRDGLMATYFRDQRYLFRDNSETLYIDFCCHLNQRGNELVVGDILNNFQDLFAKHLGPQSSTPAQ